MPLPLSGIESARGAGPLSSSRTNRNELMELTKDHLTAAFDAWAAARDGNGIVIHDEYYPEAHELAAAGWLARPDRRQWGRQLVVVAAGRGCAGAQRARWRHRPGELN
jgi:hypothetical protein